MTRHDEPAEGDVAGVAEVLVAALRRFWIVENGLGAARCLDCDPNRVRVAMLLPDAIAHQAAHLADVLRDLLAAAEQRGRVAALREASDAVKDALAPVDRTWGGAAMVVRDRVRVAMMPDRPTTNDHTETAAEFLSRTATSATERAQ